MSDDWRVLDDKLPLSDVTDAYWRFHEAAHGEPRNEVIADANWWSHEVVSGLLMRGGPLAIEVIVALSESAPDEEALGYVGAGPIEGLFFIGGREFPDNSQRLDLLEVEVRRNPKVRAALQASWGHALPPTAVERLRTYRSNEQ